MLISLSAFNFGCNCRAFLKPLQMANDILMRYFVEKEPRHHFIIITRKIPKHWKKNSTINVRSHGRSQRHCIGGETKGTEIKRFILRREGGASLNQGGVRATPWSKPLAWKTLHKLWMCIVYVRCTWVPRSNAPLQSDVVNVYSIVGIRSLWKKPPRATRRICSDSFVKSWSQRCKKVDDCMR